MSEKLQVELRLESVFLFSDQEQELIKDMKMRSGDLIEEMNSKKVERANTKVENSEVGKFERGNTYKKKPIPNNSL